MIRRWLWTRPATQRALLIGRRYGLTPKGGESPRAFRRRVVDYHGSVAGWFR